MRSITGVRYVCASQAAQPNRSRTRHFSGGNATCQIKKQTLSSAASATALSTQRPDGVSGQALLVQQQLPPPKYGRPEDAEEWPPHALRMASTSTNNAPPTTKTGRQGVACCASLVACVEERPLDYPGYGQRGMSKVVVCRASADMCPSVEPGEETPSPTPEVATPTLEPLAPAPEVPAPTP